MSRTSGWALLVLAMDAQGARGMDREDFWRWKTSLPGAGKKLFFLKKIHALKINITKIVAVRIVKPKAFFICHLYVCVNF